MNPIDLNDPPDEVARDSVKRLSNSAPNSSAVAVGPEGKEKEKEAPQTQARGVWVKFDAGGPVWISHLELNKDAVWCEDASSLKAHSSALESENASLKLEVQRLTERAFEGASPRHEREMERMRAANRELARERDEAKAALEEAKVRLARGDAISATARGLNQGALEAMGAERDSLRSKVAELEAKLVEATKVKAALPFRWRCIECESGSGVFPTEAEAEMAGQEHASTCPARLKLIDQIAAYRLVVADLARGGK